MAQQIQFVYLAQSEYDALTKQGNVLYFTSDTHRIYRGTDLYATTSFETVSAQSATFGDLTVTGDVTMSLSSVSFDEISASSITVSGSAVALEGHGHSVADISGLGDMLSGYASASHSHVIADVSGLAPILSGITSSTIYKDSGTFDQVTADVGNFRLISVSGSANFQVNNVSANAVTVNGTDVSLEGHTHGMSEITGLVEAMASSMESAVGKSALASAVQGLELSADATQKNIRETLASLISALKSVAGVVCMAFMTMFWAMDAEALSLNTNWEEVNPTNTMMDVAGVVNDERLTIAQYMDGSTLVFSNLTSISKNTLNKSGTSIKYVKFGNTVTTINNEALSGLPYLETIYIPNSVQSIGRLIFWSDNGLSNVRLPNNIISLTYGMFQGCSVLKDITIPDSVTSIERYAFYGCSSLASVTSIERYAFYGCSSLASVTIPNSVTGIGERAFAELRGLTSVTFGNSISNIEANAFQDCNNLTRMVFPGKTSEEVKALPNYPWGLTNCKFVCGKDVNEESGANGKYPLFVIDLNPGTERIWTGLELKASTNNFVGSGTVGVPFYTATTANGTTIGNDTYDWCRLYILSKRANSDIRKWIRITNTFDLNGYAPLSLAIIVDPTLFKRGQDASWLEEKNPELIWSYTKVGLDSSETDQDGQNVWRPVMPVKWYKELPAWANQNETTPDGSNVTTYTNMQMRISILEEQLRGLNNALHVINTGTNLVEEL